MHIEHSDSRMQCIIDLAWLVVLSLVLGLCLAMELM